MCYSIYINFQIIKKEVIVINVIVYYPNERFISSLKELYSTLELDYILHATSDYKNLEKLIGLELGDIVFTPKDCDLKRNVEKRIFLSEDREETGLYIYQNATSFLKAISDYTISNSDKVVVNLLIPTGFNSDFELVSSAVEKLNESGIRSLILDTNPCRAIHESNWDYLTKEILNENISKNDIPYIDSRKCYYIKPFNSFKDYYINCSLYGNLISKLTNVEGIDYIFVLHYLNDFKSMAEIEKYSNVNIVLTYGAMSNKLISESDINQIYKRQFLELSCDDYTKDKNRILVSSDNTWNSLKNHYREFELSLFENISKC